MAEQWTNSALCAQADGDYWFLDNTTANQDGIAVALTICSLCDVSPQCLEYALVNDERFGIWGGMLPKPRNRLRRKLGIPARLAERVHGTEAGYAQHRRAGTPACRDCLRAASIASRERKANG